MIKGTQVNQTKTHTRRVQLSSKRGGTISEAPIWRLQPGTVFFTVRTALMREDKRNDGALSRPASSSQGNFGTKDTDECLAPRI